MGHEADHDPVRAEVDHHGPRPNLEDHDHPEAALIPRTN
jgi:hypothetical protein